MPTCALCRCRADSCLRSTCLDGWCWKDPLPPESPAIVSGAVDRSVSNGRVERQAAAAASALCPAGKKHRCAHVLVHRVARQATANGESHADPSLYPPQADPAKRPG